MRVVQLIQTSAAGDRLTPQAAPAFVPGLNVWHGGQSVVLEPRVRYQTLLGFGGAFTEATCWTLAQLDEPARDQILRAYFHATEGNGYRFARTHINSCDFSLGNWACTEVPGDTELAHFSLERTHRWITPVIRRAQELGDFALLASPWSPPAWMKSNGQMNHGGHLLPEYRRAWAQHYVRWVQEMAKAGVPTWGLTVQNEPEATQVWDSCLYTAEEERDFVRDHLGPALHDAGLQHLKLIVWDHNREVAFHRGATVLGDPEAARYTWGTGVHWYSGDHFDQLEQLNRAFPDKHLVFTEGCWEGGVKLGQYDRGARYAHHIIGDLNHHCEIWLDWNLVLDQTGGPNHVGNLCDAPVVVDTHTKQVHYQTSFYYLAHFSRYLPQGSVRIGRSDGGGPIESTAFIDPEGRLVLVAHNPTPHPVRFNVIVPGGGFPVTVPGDAIQTWVMV